jgi:N-acetylneuraminate synthase/pseudaminic acid synthase
MRDVMVNKVFIVAEMSCNFLDNFDIAKKIILEAKRGGADAVKMQTFKAEYSTLNCRNSHFLLHDDTLWDDKYLFDLYKETSMPWEWQPMLKEYADSIGITLFSMTSCKESTDYLESFNNPIYKIASFEANDPNLIRYVAAKGKPMIISVGICDEKEMQEAIDACKSVGNNDITLLKCTSAYPAKLEDMNLLTIPDMIQKFGSQGVKIGLSDHSMNIETVVAGVALGARVIEKHFTLDRALGGADSAFSLNPVEFKAMVEAVRNTEKVLGKVYYDSNPKGRKFARSLFVVKDIKKGEKFTPENVRSIRPSDGLHPRYYDMVIGRGAAEDLKRGEPLRQEDVIGLK